MGIVQSVELEKSSLKNKKLSKQVVEVIDKIKNKSIADKAKKELACFNYNNYNNQNISTNSADGYLYLGGMMISDDIMMSLCEAIKSIKDEISVIEFVILFFKKLFFMFINLNF